MGITNAGCLSKYNNETMIYLLGHGCGNFKNQKIKTLNENMHIKSLLKFLNLSTKKKKFFLPFKWGSYLPKVVALLPKQTDASLINNNND